MGLGDNIIVNNFMFCRDHGSEYCHACFCDHRLCNNTIIEDDIANLSSLFALDDREPINAFALGAVRRSGEQYECWSHKSVDCATCFNWVRIIRAEVREAERTEQWLKKREKWVNRVDP